MNHHTCDGVASNRTIAQLQEWREREAPPWVQRPEMLAEPTQEQPHDGVWCAPVSGVSS